MPCRSDYMEPTAREIESIKVQSLLLEVGLRTDQPKMPYGDVSNLDRDTADLCLWCGTHDVTKQSLDLQIWWRDHRKADDERDKRAAFSFGGGV